MQLAFLSKFIPRTNGKTIITAKNMIANGFTKFKWNLCFILNMKEASERGVIVVNLTQCLAGKVNMGGYATGCALADSGVISGFDMTPEAALAKLHYLLSQNLSYEEVKERMQQVLRGEMSL